MRLISVLGAVLVLLSGAATMSAAAPADPGAARLAAIEAVNVDRANFGGVYIDAEGVLVIQYVGDNAGRATVEQRLVPGVAVRWEKVERSRADLDAMVDTIRERNLGDVFAISIDTIANQVAVTVGPGGSVDEVRAALADYGDGVAIALGADIPVTQVCTSRVSCTPWRGGILISANNGSSFCTWGFQASRNGNLIMVTAGHCHQTGGKFNHGGVTIGSSGIGKNAIDPSTFEGIDVSRTRVTGAGFPTTQNIIYATSATKSFALTGVLDNNQFAVGQGVEKAGMMSNYSNGGLTSVSYTYRLRPAEDEGSLVMYPNCTYETWQNCPYAWGMTASVHSEGGDSGAPVYGPNPVPPYYGAVFMGILSAGDGSTMVFAPAESAAAALDLDFWCTTGGCP